jgi:hypothetical protein
MSNKRITDLTELTTPTTDDVFPVVDIATNTTTKVQLGNLPVPTAVTTALATKQDTLVSGTNIKTVNSTSLVGSGNVAVQETLVSGTNIKTLNSTSLLGSGDIVLTANPSGVAGAIQFSDGSAFASDAANLFWDDTNNRLGIGTNAPTSRLQIVTDDAINPQAFSNQTTVIAGTASQGALMTAFSTTNGGFINALWPGNAWFKMNYGGTNHSFSVGGTVTAVIDTNTTFGNGATSLGARVGIKGSGSTSATTSLLVQDSAGNNALQVTDDRIVKTFNGLNLSGGYLYANGVGTASLFGGTSWLFDTTLGGSFRFRNGSMALGASVADATAHLDVQSTTKGFLPPRMTTTQKNAIATPAAGLVVYDSTTNKLCCYDGSTWNDLF